MYIYMFIYIEKNVSRQFQYPRVFHILCTGLLKRASVICTLEYDRT